MDTQEYEIMYQVEQQHWWYQGMEDITRAVLNRCYAPGAGLRILDAGCGTGAAMTTYLAEYGDVTGFDLSEVALNFCKIRNARRLVCASVGNIPFPSDSFDLITSFDVLYERAVPEDAASLAELARVLVRGGRVLLRLPAYDWLRGSHDEVIHTARRYTAGRAAHILQESGLTVERVSYANTFLFPIALAKRFYDRIWMPGERKSDLSLGVGPFNQFLRSILTLEAPLVSRMGLPFGLSVIAVGKKP